MNLCAIQCTTTRSCSLLLLLVLPPAPTVGFTYCEGIDTVPRHVPPVNSLSSLRSVMSKIEWRPWICLGWWYWRVLPLIISKLKSSGLNSSSRSEFCNLRNYCSRSIILFWNSWASSSRRSVCAWLRSLSLLKSSTIHLNSWFMSPNRWSSTTIP